MQLSLPIDHKPELRASRIWLVATERRQVDAVAGRLQSRPHSVVDCADGRQAIGPEDILLLYDPENTAFRAFGPVGADAKSTSNELRNLIEVSRNVVARERSREVVGIFLGEPGRNCWSPHASSNRLERTLAALRHRNVTNLSAVRADRSRAALEELSPDADLLLRAVLELELIDASVGDAPYRQPYLDWANKYGPLGRPRLAQRPGLREGESASPQSENLFGWPLEKSALPAHRVGYRFFSMLVQKVTVSTLCLPNVSRASYGRPELKIPPIPQAQVCAWIRGATSDRLKPFVRCNSISKDGKEYEFAAGLDCEIAVRLGVGGKAGVKLGDCEVRAFSSTCRIVPERFHCSVGEAALLQIVPGRARSGIVDLEFSYPPISPIALRTDLSQVPWN